MDTGIFKICAAASTATSDTDFSPQTATLEVICTLFPDY